MRRIWQEVEFLDFLPATLAHSATLYILSGAPHHFI
jgi:hypothetical protein